MTATEDLDAVRTHIAANGEWKAELTEGINFSTGAEPLGLRVFTRGRVGTSNRWRKEFVIWVQEDQTLRQVATVLGIGGPS